MVRFVFTEERVSGRGYDTIYITVWQLKNNKPYFVGRVERSSGSWKGDMGEACEIIKKVMNYKTTRSDPYRPSDFVRKDLEVLNLASAPSLR